MRWLNALWRATLANRAPKAEAAQALVVEARELVAEAKAQAAAEKDGLTGTDAEEAAQLAVRRAEQQTGRARAPGQRSCQRRQLFPLKSSRFPSRGSASSKNPAKRYPRDSRGAQRDYDSTARRGQSRQADGG